MTMASTRLPSSTSTSRKAFSINLYLLLASLLGIALSVPTTTKETVTTSNYTEPTQKIPSTLKTTPKEKGTRTGLTENSLDEASTGTTQSATFPPLLEGFVSTKPPVEPNLYVLTVKNTTWNALGTLLLQNPDFIYVKVNFLDVTFDSDTAYLNDTPSVIDPYTWTWACGQVGYFLRSFPPNFFYISPSTFSFSVYKITLNVSINAVETFMEQNDSIKLQQISNSLTHVFRKVSKRFNVTLDKFKVCQEFFDNRKHTATVLAWVLSLHVYMYQPASIKVVCWSEDGIERVQKKLEVSLWLTILYYAVIVVGALYVLHFPGIVLQIVNQGTPLNEESLEILEYLEYLEYLEVDKHINRHSYLPLGLHYYLCTNGNKSTFILGLRWVVCAVLIFVLAYLEDILLRRNDDRYTVRKKSAYRTVVDRDLDIALTAVLPIVLIPIIAYFIFRLKKRNDKFCIENKENLFPKLNLKLKLKENLWTNLPEPDRERLPWYKRLNHYMKIRSMKIRRMAFNIRVLWDILLKKLAICVKVETPNAVLLLLKYLLLLGRLAILLPYALFLLIIYSPSVYILQWCCWYAYRKFKNTCNMREKNGILTAIFVIIFLPVGLVLIASYLRVVTGIAILAGDYLKYTFSGCLLNVHDIQPSFYLVFTIVGFAFSTVKNFYDSYHSFFVIIVETAIKHDESVWPERKLTKYATISTKLFWHIVHEVKPIKIDLIFHIAQLLGMAFIALAVFDVLEKVENLGGISQSTSTIISVAITVVFPILNPSLKGDEDKQRRDIEDALNRHVKKQGDKIWKDIKTYQELCKECLKEMNKRKLFYKEEIRKFVSDHIDNNMFSDNKDNDENTEAEPKIEKIINDACEELNIQDSIFSNSLALTTPCKRRYNLLLTKEGSEILRTGKLGSKEAIDQVAENIVTTLLKLDERALYAHTTEKAALNFQSSIRKVVEKIRDESSSKEDEDATKITQTKEPVKKNMQNKKKKRGRGTVKKYLQVLIERDLKILRDLIVQDLLRKQDGKEQKEQKPTPSESGVTETTEPGLCETGPM